ncbi:restriction endonuclease subunit S [Enterococcus casseliflavus]|uniref:restriction endonuclease subunit S n=1 Tax=Enterococcus casseliflavus TaxID=37734 RepID=UPI0039A67E52
MSNDTQPEIRFPGFTDDWEERKLGDVGNTFTGLTGKTKEDFGHGSAKFVTYVNVFQNPIATLDQLDAIEIDEKQNQVQKGDIFFTTSSETPEEVGMSSVWTHDTENVYLNSFTFGYRPRVSFDLNYMASMLRSPSIRKKITFLAQGISRYNISKTKMLEIKIPTPTLSEQEKIGSFFKQLDDTIALHQRKLDLLKETKKGFLQKMFPKNGAKVPEIRFPGFTEDWELCKLGGLATISSGGTPNRENPSYWNGDIPWATTTEVNYQIIKNTNEKITFEGLSNSSAKLMPKGTILMAMYGQGKTRGQVGILGIESTTNQANANIIVNNHTNNFFVYQQLVKKYEEIRKSANEGGQANLSLSIVKDITISWTPSLDEQKKIGLFFKRIDETIALHQRKLDLLKETKKGFLQKMFV